MMPGSDGPAISSTTRLLVCSGEKPRVTKDCAVCGDVGTTGAHIRISF